MNAAIKMIHVAKREIRMADDDYRAMLERVTGTASLRAMSDGQHQKVLGEMKRLGFQARPRSGRLKGAYGRKFNALWLSAYALGLVRNPSEDALIAFVERQTGIAHANWVRDQRDAARVIEALKKWMIDKAGVEWPKAPDSDGRAAKVAVIAAQHRLLGFAGPYLDNPANSSAQLDKIIAGLGAQIRGAK